MVMMIIEIGIEMRIECVIEILFGRMLNDYVSGLLMRLGNCVLMSIVSVV